MIIPPFGSVTEAKKVNSATFCVQHRFLLVFQLPVREYRSSLADPMYDSSSIRDLSAFQVLQLSQLGTSRAVKPYTSLEIRRLKFHAMKKPGLTRTTDNRQFVRLKSAINLFHTFGVAREKMKFLCHAD